jgi:hypothetical protein
MGKISIQYGINKNYVQKGTHNFGFNFIIVNSFFLSSHTLELSLLV